MTDAELPAPGALVRDTARDRIGEFMGKQGPYFMLRPLGGGREWEVSPGYAEPLSPEEVLSVKVKQANAQSTGAVL
ncbi:hypothetical protein [Streptomyces caniscabiei]|uniref:hypothetical protein n=1 Tax=Streptomyces caniscabiei TaxID=2746961 RepID=UPI001872FA5E|nr:hypothetical protein [Streptomyces caniscabiei]MBE4797407.1 hypothetical protein [Streptomyces caniscabiei]